MEVEKGDQGRLLVASIDGKRHDSSCHVQEFENIAFLRYERLQEKGKYFYRMQYVYRNIVHSVMITEDGEVYVVEGGNKSGQGNTTVDNCLIQLTRFIYCLLKLGKLEEVERLKDPFPPLLILGDDILSWFKTLTERDYKRMQKIMLRDLGVIWKIKLGDEENWEFCSHSPVGDLAAITKASIVSHLNMTQKFSTNIERLRGELIEAYPHKDLFADMYEFALYYLPKYREEVPTIDFYRDLWYGYNTVPRLNGNSCEKYKSGDFSLSSLFTETRNMSLAAVKADVKKKGEHIARLEREIHNIRKTTTHGEVVSHHEAVGTCKKFAMDLINPEQSTDLKWPDSYSERTSTYKALNNFFLPVALTEHDDYPQGSYYAEVHPELNDTIMYLEEFDSSAENTYVTGGFTTFEEDNNFGFFDENMKPVRGNIIGGGKYQLVFNLRDRGGTPQIPRFSDSDVGTVSEAGFWYLPCKGGGVHIWTIDWINLGGAFDWKCQQVSRTGAVLIETTGTTSSLTSAGTSMTLVASPDAVHSFKLVFEITPLSGDLPVLKVDTQASFLLTELRMANEPLSDATQLNRDIEKYRVVAQSALLTYVGSELTNAGDCSALLYRGGLPSQYSRLSSYSDIAEHPDAYEGPLRDGTYVYWEGQDAVDYSFRSIFAINEYRRPYA
jgi:hypothetical protein